MVVACERGRVQCVPSAALREVWFIPLTWPVLPVPHWCAPASCYCVSASSTQPRESASSAFIRAKTVSVCDHGVSTAQSTPQSRNSVNGCCRGSKYTEGKIHNDLFNVCKKQYCRCTEYPWRDSYKRSNSGCLGEGNWWLGNGIELGYTLCLWNLIHMLENWNFANRQLHNLKSSSHGAPGWLSQ